MTFEELQDEVWDNLGQPSDLDPDTYSTIGEWVNRGYRRICFWKFPNGRILRFRALEGELFFQTPLVEGTAQDGATSTITLAAGASGTDDYYNGWVVEVDGGTGVGQRRLIVDYSGGARLATVATDWTTTPDSTSTYNLFKQFMKFVTTGSHDIVLDPNDSIYDALKVVDLKDEKDLDRPFRTDTFSGNLTTPGTPGEYLVFGDRIIFDCPIDEARWYKLEYVKIPANMVNSSDEPAIPEPWHEGISMWATWKGLIRGQEPPMAYAMQRNLDDFMGKMVEQYSFDDEREDSYLVVDFGG